MFIKKIVNEKSGDKFWTHVYFDNDTLWVPALWEEGLIAQKVVICERIKYPNLNWDAGTMPIQFITHSMNGENVEALCHQYKLTTQPSFKRLEIVLKNSRQNGNNESGK